MHTPEPNLSPIERRMLSAIASGDVDGMPPDWLALQRLKAFGLVEFIEDGPPKLTAEGKRVAKDKI